MRLIDAHAHLPLDTPLSRQMHIARDVRVLNICVASNELGGLDAQRRWYAELHAASPDRFAWVTSFPLDGFGQRDWADRAIDIIQTDYARGAVGCKVWKNVGMELRDTQTGEYVFVDDPRMSPVFEALQRLGRPLLMHTGEPVDAWLPLDPDSPHYGYFASATQWHWYGRTDIPSHERLIASRDAIVERYPKLRVIGLHYGSQERDLPGIAERLDRWPNYMIDTAARLGDAMRNARRDLAATRAFHDHYADRIIWGVDPVLTLPASTMSDQSVREYTSSLSERYDLEIAFFSGDELVACGPIESPGLSLDAKAVELISQLNAERVYAI